MENEDWVLLKFCIFVLDDLMLETRSSVLFTRLESRRKTKANVETKTQKYI